MSVLWVVGIGGVEEEREKREKEIDGKRLNGRNKSASVCAPFDSNCVPQ